MRSKAVFVLACLLLLPVGGYLWYVVDRGSKIRQLNQRELGRAAENLEQTIDQAIDNVRHLRNDPDYACSSFALQQPYLSFAREQQRDFTQREECLGFPWQGSRPELRSDNGIRVVARVNTDSSAEFDLNVGKILGELPLTDAFEYLIVADDKGEIVFQEKRGVEERWNDEGRWLEEYARPLGGPKGTGVRLVSLSKITLPSGETVEYEDLRRTSNAVRLRLAGEDYDLFLQTLSFERADAAWTLGGLVSVAESRKKAMLIAHEITYLLVALLILGPLGWPFFKRWALAPNERPTFADGYRLLLSTSALLMVATVLVLDLDSYFATERKASSGLRLLADSAATNFLQELRKMREQLTTYDRIVKRSPSFVACDDTSKAAYLLKSPEQRDYPEGSAGVPLPEPSAYNSFRLVFWVAPSGKQVIKTTTGEKTTPLVNVGSRPYFQEAKAGRLWTMAGDDGRDEPFYLQPFRSMTTGEFASGLSIRSSLPTETCGEWTSPDDGRARMIAVLTASLSAAGDQSLPYGYGFAIVDQRGSVLFHSDTRHALREHLFGELGAPRLLYAALRSRQAQGFDTSYHTRPHEFYLRPMPELLLARTGAAAGDDTPIGWSVVAYRDLSVINTVNGQVLATCILWILLYILLLQLLPTLASLVLYPHQARWLWPNSFNEPLYRRLTIQLGCLAVVSAFPHGVDAPNTLLAITWLSPLVTIGIALANYARWEPKIKPENWEGCNRPPLAGKAIYWHFSATVSLWLLLSVLPAVGFFRLTWNEEFGRLVAFQNNWQSRQEHDIRRAMAERTKEIPNSRRYLYDRLRYLHYSVTPFDETPSGGDERQASSVPDLGWRWDYNDLAVKLRYQGADRNLLASSGLDASVGVFSVLGGMLLLVPLGWWIRYSANKLLLADEAEEPVSESALVGALAKGPARATLVVAPKADQETRIPTALRRYLSENAPCRAGAVAADGGSLAATSAKHQAERPELKIRVGLWEELAKNEERLDVLAELETAVREERGRLVAFSKENPFVHAKILGGVDASGESEPTPGGPSPLEEELARWRTLEAEFAIVRLGNTAEEIARLPENGSESQGPRPSIELRTAGPDHCRALWDSCSDNEKLVLIHVAEEGFANPAQRETVRELLRRGLLVMQPDLRLVSDSFRKCVLQSQDRAAVAQWEKPVGRANYGNLKWVLAGLLIAIGFFLFSTQREWLLAGAGAITAITGILSGVLKITDQLSRGQTGNVSG